MKKTLIITNLLTLCLLYFVSWKEDKPAPTPAPDNATCINYDYTTGSVIGRVSAGTAVLLSRQYKDNVLNKVKLPNDQMNTRSILFTLETLKNFLWEVEHQACVTMKGKPIPEMGIRIYEAVYPEQSVTDRNKDLYIANKQYGNRMTVFMVPTYEENGVYYDCDPGKFGSNNTLLKLKDAIKIANTSSQSPRADARMAAPPVIAYPSILMLTTSTPQLLRIKPNTNARLSIQNHGSLVPPDNADGDVF